MHDPVQPESTSACASISGNSSESEGISVTNASNCRPPDLRIKISSGASDVLPEFSIDDVESSHKCSIDPSKYCTGDDS